MPGKTFPEGDSNECRSELREWEQESVGPVPGFRDIQQRIATSPHLDAGSRRSFGESTRLTWELALAQIRVMPSVVVPITLGLATMAVLAGRYLALNDSSTNALTGFSCVVLLGVVFTATMVMSPSPSDEIALSTPLGPPVVVLARLFLVLAADMVIGVLASCIVAGWIGSQPIGPFIAGWLVPLVLVAGLSTFVAIWSVPWAGIAVGVIIIPILVPLSTSSAPLELDLLNGRVGEALSPTVLVAIGVGVAGLAVASARRAALVRTASAQTA